MSHSYVIKQIILQIKQHNMLFVHNLYIHT